MKLSVLILTKNEEENIADCLKSVRQLAEEIIVVDAQSVDRTVKIAQKDGAKVFIHHFVDFAEARNFGLSKASGEWVLYVDADERVTEELKDEIQKQITFKNQPFSAFDIPRKNIRLGGQEMRFGGWWPDYVTRLFRKKDLQGWYGEVHESPIVNGETGKLTNPLLHFGRDLKDIVQKTIEWSGIEARLLFEAKHPSVTWWRLGKVWLEEFWRRFILLQGFRDGTAGLIEAIYQSFSRFITYARLWEIQQRKSR